MRRRARGFTLTELMAVVTIIGVMSAAAIYSMSGYGNSQNPAALARSLQFTLGRARTDAVSDGRQRRLSCTNVACAYLIASDTGMAAPLSWTAAGDGARAGNHAEIWNITATTDNASNNAGAKMTVTKTVTFYPDGTATAATIYIDDTSTLTNRNKYKVYVYAGTGLSRLVNNW